MRPKSDEGLCKPEAISYCLSPLTAFVLPQADAHCHLELALAAVPYRQGQRACLVARGVIVMDRHLDN